MLAYGSLDEPDPYCPKKGAVSLGELVSAGDRERLHTGNVCTLLVRG